MDASTPRPRWSSPESWRPSHRPRGSPGREDAETPEAPAQIPGDANQDGRRNLADAVDLLLYLWTGEGSPLPCGNGSPDSAANRQLVDSSGDSAIDARDAIHDFRHLFGLGPAPIAGTLCRVIEGCPDLCR